MLLAVKDQKLAAFRDRQRERRERGHAALFFLRLQKFLHRLIGYRDKCAFFKLRLCGCKGGKPACENKQKRHKNRYNAF